jgi:hypothetical protein
MIKDWDVPKICSEISKIAWAESDPRMDGFVTWGCKQDLYQLKWFIESKLAKCSTYAGEEEYITEHEKNLTFKRIKGEIL